ncbi:MAG: ribonuclease P [Candidatus Aenigmarchaeota archaeon]|nr:ribonuclease P [Candidatus Aenigmarchaeota archaeon]
MRRRSKKPKWQLKIAKERIDILFELAKKELKKYPKRSRRYVELARKIGLRYNIRLSKERKRSFCKKCNTLLYIGKTAKITSDKLPELKVVKCLNCGEKKKIPK